MIEIEKKITTEWKDSKGKPVDVVIQRLTPVEKSRCYNIDGTVDLGSFIRKGVVSVNMSPWEGKEIKTGEDINNTIGLDVLFSEVAVAVVKFNRLVVPKN